MRRIGEVRRLKAAGMNNSDIARSTGIGRTTVYEYLSRAQAARLKWPLPVELDEAALEAKLFPAPTSELAAARPVPDWTAVHRELKRGRHVTLRLLWLEWRQDHPEGLGYSQFCNHYQRWLGVQDPVLRMEYAAGERMFVERWRAAPHVAAQGHATDSNIAGSRPRLYPSHKTAANARLSASPTRPTSGPNAAVLWMPKAPIVDPTPKST